MTTKITVRNNGSLLVEGDFEVEDENGNRFDLAGRTRVTLCRCGQSSKKPFCDSTHKRVGFRSEVTAFALEPPQPKP